MLSVVAVSCSRHEYCTLYCRSMASLGSSLILGLFLMFFARLAYLKETYILRQRGDRAAVKTAVAVEQKVGICLPTTAVAAFGRLLHEKKQEVGVCASVPGHRRGCLV